MAHMSEVYCSIYSVAWLTLATLTCLLALSLCSTDLGFVSGMHHVPAVSQAIVILFSICDRLTIAISMLA